MTEQAFAGLKVIDLTRRVSGSYCTKLLADFGAEVIKVEDVEGDAARKMNPFLGDEPHPEKSGAFFYLNTNKKSITLNLKNETGAKLFKELVKEADVLVESFAPGAMSELGLSYETLREVNPRLIVTSISNFGQTSPRRDYKATNLTLSALGGAMYTLRLPSKPRKAPVLQGGVQVEYSAGLISFSATVAALINRFDTNEGMRIDMSMMQCVASTLTGVIGEYSYLGLSRRTNPLPIHGYPGMENYPCKDGWINPAPGLGGAPYIAFIIGKPELQDEPIFARPGARMAEPEKFDALVLPWVKEHGKWEIVKEAQEMKLSFAPILSPGEVLEDEQLKARDFFARVEHPAMGEVTYPGAPAKLSETPWRAGRAPLLGEHNEEVYGGLGYTREEVVRLREGGTI